MTAHPTDTPDVPRGAAGSAADVGLLVLRLFFGGLLFMHGAQKLFGWFNGPGWDATTSGFDQMGYNPGELFGTLAGLSEMTGGALLFVGLLTPLAAAIAVGTMINAINATWDSGLTGDAAGPGYEMALLFGIAAAALAFTGPGRYSLDFGRPWQRRGVVWGVAAIALGVVAGAITLVLEWAL